MFSKLVMNNLRQFSTSISITSIAFIKIKDILKKTNNDIFFLSAKSGGCNGFNYVFKPIKNSEFEDICKKQKPIVIENNKTRVFIDPLAEIYLLGTKVDYIEEDFSNGIYDSGFKFEPDDDVASSCGCGISFGIK